MGPSSAGALGWTQFMPATWKIWGMDADGDGKASPYSSADAIFSTARYLRASGAPRSYRKALFAYNHAHWYVNDVLKRSRRSTASGARQPRGGHDARRDAARVGGNQRRESAATRGRRSMTARDVLDPEQQPETEPICRSAAFGVVAADRRRRRSSASMRSSCRAAPRGPRGRARPSRRCAARRAA